MQKFFFLADVVEINFVLKKNQHQNMKNLVIFQNNTFKSVKVSDKKKIFFFEKKGKLHYEKFREF